MTYTMSHIRYYWWITPQAALAHAIWRLSRRLMPSGHSRGIFRDNDAALKSEIAAYGRALGSIEPRLRLAMSALPLVVEVAEQLRAAKMYTEADNLRAAIALMNAWGATATPSRHGKDGK